LLWSSTYINQPMTKSRMVVASTLRIQAPENVRNKWSLAMRTFSNSRCNCEVQSSLDFSTTETGCLMSNASSKDIADLGIVVMKDSIADVKKMWIPLKGKSTHYHSRTLTTCFLRRA
jgi:hypothetical protein